MQQSVTAQEVSRACELLNAAGVDPLDANRGQIRSIVGVGDRRARTIREWIRRGGLDSKSIQPQESTLQETFDTAYEKYREWIGMSYVHGVSKKAEAPSSDRVTIISASDFHTPFHSKPALHALLQEADRVDMLVIPGDFLTSWSWSRWPKSKKETEPVEEFREGQAVLSTLAEAFKKVVLFGGNHCARPRKYLSERLPPEVMSYLEITAPGSLNPLQLMASSLSNVEIVQPVVKDHAQFSFLWQRGDCVFSHAEKYSIIPGKAASGPVLHWLKSFAEPLGIVTGVRALVQAHTHQISSAIADYGVLAIESGCMCDLESYVGDPKIMSPRPPAIGWTVVVQDNGRTDWRETRPIPLYS
jgi:hypothetical protein